MRPTKPRMGHSVTSKERYDWRAPAPRYVESSRVPWEMGGHGQQMFDASLRALISPRATSMRPVGVGFMGQGEVESLPTAQAALSTVSLTTGYSPKPLRPLRPMSPVGPSLRRFREEGGADWVGSVMSELARECEWETRSKEEPSTTLPSSLSADLRSQQWSCP